MAAFMWTHSEGIVAIFLDSADPTAAAVLPLAAVLIVIGAVFQIVAKLADHEQDEPRYWTITFHDPQRTRQVGGPAPVAFLEYDWAEARLYRYGDGQLDEIEHVRPQEHLLIRHMDQRNRENGYTAVMCSFAELIEALWGDDGYEHTESDVARVVWTLRRKIEPENDAPRILQTVRGLGYRLVTRPRGPTREALR